MIHIGSGVISHLFVIDMFTANCAALLYFWSAAQPLHCIFFIIIVFYIED